MWKELSLWKKNLTYFILMLVILFIMDIFENNSTMGRYVIVIILTIIVMILTYLFSEKFKEHIIKFKSASYVKKGLFLGIFIAIIIGLFKTIKNLIGQIQPGDIFYGCKKCSGMFWGWGGCSVNITPNCPMEFIFTSISYAIPLIIIGIVIGWIYDKIKQL